jgi:alpha-L-fucosidase
MPGKDEQQLPAHVMVRTKLSGTPKVTLLGSNRELTYTAYEGVLMVSIPAELRGTLAKHEAVVIRVAV